MEICMKNSVMGSVGERKTVRYQLLLTAAAFSLSILLLFISA